MAGPAISLIVAAASNNVIGAQGALPWRQRADLLRFKEITLGKPVVMGRKTWQSIGRPLPGRQNIVITRQSDFIAAGADVVQSPAAALAVAGAADEIMIIGGGEVYALFLDKASRIFLTRVHIEVSGDASFPALQPDEWQLVSSEARASDDDNDFDVDFQVYQRIA